jgi:hypothetical protein
MRCKLLRNVLVLLPLASLPLSAVAFENGPIDGRVIDVDTRQPISGVIVVAKWHRAEGFIADSAHVCNHVATAVSDAQGRYHIDKWQQKTSFAESLFASPYLVSLQGSNEILAAARDAIYAEARSIATADEEDQKVLRSLDQMRDLDSGRSGEPQVESPRAPPQH